MMRWMTWRAIAMSARPNLAIALNFGLDTAWVRACDPGVALNAGAYTGPLFSQLKRLPWDRECV
jgi:hypothetical protein